MCFVQPSLDKKSFQNKKEQARHRHGEAAKPEKLSLTCACAMLTAVTLAAMPL